MQIREAEPADAGALAEIFYSGVRDGAAPHYSSAERAAWAPHQPTPEAWAQRLSGLLTLVADDGTAQAFMALRLSDGYLDFAFVRPNQRGTGVAQSLYAVLENRARVAGLTRLHTQASHLARPFFQRLGWQVVRTNNVQRGDQTLANWLMEKALM